MPSVNLSAVPAPVVAAACLGTAATAAVSYALYRRNSHQQLTFQDAGKVKQIFIYPIKSLPPIELSQAELTPFGMKFKDVKDREFLLVEGSGEHKFITAREEPSLLLLQVAFNESKKCLEVSSRNPQVNMEKLDLSLEAMDQNKLDSAKILEVCTWKADHPYKAMSLEKASVWFSKYLGKQVILVRLVNLVGSRHRDAPDHFHDAAGLNFLSQSSVDNLLDLMRDPSANVSHRNFRPSILVDSKHPYDEDFWSRARIGDAETEFHSRCDRCILTTINPDSGVKTNKEPLVTLRKFRVNRSDVGVAKYKFRPLFSSHHVIKKSGNIFVGQTILAQRAPSELV